MAHSGVAHSVAHSATQMATLGTAVAHLVAHSAPQVATLGATLGDTVQMARLSDAWHGCGALGGTLVDARVVAT